MQSFVIRPAVTMAHHISHEVLPHSSLTAQAAVKTALSPAPRHIPTRHAIPAAWYRAGTSKGLFFKRQHLPEDQSAWRPIVLSAMGSDDGDIKQLNGMGGGTSTTSKVAVVSRSTRPGVDLEYTFAQVVPDSGKLDMSGNCGNIASGVAPFALDEGMIKTAPGQDRIRVRILNTNTNKIMESQVHLDTDGHAYDSGCYFMPGMKSSGSPIEVSFIEPGGSMTGKILPTGHAEDWIHVTKGLTSFSVCATLIDVANPFVLVDPTTLPAVYHQLGPQAPETLSMIEDIRRVAAVQMGLAVDVAQAARTRGTPKIAVISPPDSSADVCVQAFSAGRAHPSVQLTGAVCLSAALTIPDTVVSRMKQNATEDIAGLSDSSCPSPMSYDSGFSEEDSSTYFSAKQVKIKHSSGIIEASVRTSADERKTVESVTITRTARRLFEGNVFYHL